MVNSNIVIRKTFAQVEDIHLVAGESDSGGTLRKVAVCAVIGNPFAGRGYVENLGDLIDGSGAIGTLIGQEAARLLQAPVESYGKGAIVGTAGEQEHGNAALTSIFGNAFRDAVDGGEAWITSVTKVGAPGGFIDVPLAFKDDIWVRSHYDAIEVRVPCAPLSDEIVIIAAVSNRGRINARLGGKTVEEARADDAQ